MNAILRSLIVWLVLLALPFQGMAAAAPRPCDGIPAPAAPAHHAMGVAGGHHDHAAMQHAAAGHHGDGHHSGHDGAKCGCCPACVGGPALAPAAPGAIVLQAAPSAAIPFDPGHFPSFEPALPERPPRSLLA